MIGRKQQAALSVYAAISVFSMFFLVCNHGKGLINAEAEKERKNMSREVPTTQPGKWLALKLARQTKSSAGFLVPLADDKLSNDWVFSKGTYFRNLWEAKIVIEKLPPGTEIVTDKALTYLTENMVVFEGFAEPITDLIKSVSEIKLPKVNFPEEGSWVLVKFVGQTNTEAGIAYPMTSRVPPVDIILAYGVFVRDIQAIRHKFPDNNNRVSIPNRDMFDALRIDNHLFESYEVPKLNGL